MTNGYKQFTFGQSRGGPVVFNSEHRNCAWISSDTTEKEDGEAEVAKGMSAEELIDMMHFGQVMTSIVSMRVISNNNSFSSSYGGLLYQVPSKRREP